MTSARVDMGEPALAPADIPAGFTGDQVLERPLETEMGTHAVTCVSMGNPHAVIWVEDVDAAPLDTLGPIVEQHPMFPRRTNVEFAQVLQGTDRVRLRVWERGVGETLACGTGACATLVAAALSGRTGRTATIELPGGELLIEWGPDGHVYMTGTADEVYQGVIDLPDEE
jgi:diaminopimelate epimerase